MVVAKLGPAFREPPAPWDWFLSGGVVVLLVVLLFAGFLVLVAGFAAGGHDEPRR